MGKRMSEEGEDVTPEQTDKIVSYSAATGNDDLDVCQSNLREHDWDLAAAINATMGSSSVPDLQASSSNESLSISGEGIRQRNVPSDEIPAPPPIGPLLPPNHQTQTALVPSSFFSDLFSSLFAFTRLLLSSPQTLVSNAYSFAWSWWNSLGPELPPLQQVQDFKISFNKKYDEISWLNCSYKFAIILLTLKSDLSDRIEFWGCDVKFSEGARTADQLYVGSFPSILIAGLQDKQQQIIYRTCNPDIPLEEVKTRIEMAEAELVTARHEEQMRRMDRELREEQDLEFQRTMEADRVRMEELKKQKEEEELKLKMAEEKENMKIRRQTEHRERRISAKQNLASEPTSGGLRIQFKLPNGSRHTRKFLEEQKVSDLFIYVQSLDDAPGDYFLSTVFPTKKIDLADNSKTLEDFGIKNNDQLMVQAIANEFSSDDSSEDSD